MGIGNVTSDHLSQILKMRKRQASHLEDEISEIEKLVEQDNGGIRSSKRKRAKNLEFSRNEFSVVKALVGGGCNDCRELAERAFGKDKAQDMANTTTNTFNAAKKAVERMSVVFERLRISGVVEIGQIESLGLPCDQAEFYRSLSSYEIVFYQSLVNSLRRRRNQEENPTWMSF
jgi:hypothetical protein